MNNPLKRLLFSGFIFFSAIPAIMTSRFRSMAVYRKPRINKTALYSAHTSLPHRFSHMYKIIRQYLFKFNLHGILYFQRHVLL